MGGRVKFDRGGNDGLNEVTTKLVIGWLPQNVDAWANEGPHKKVCEDALTATWLCFLLGVAGQWCSAHEWVQVWRNEKLKIFAKYMHLGMEKVHI